MKISIVGVCAAGSFSSFRIGPAALALICAASRSPKTSFGLSTIEGTPTSLDSRPPKTGNWESGGNN